MIAGSCACTGQQPANEQPYTLRAFADLIEVPTMVLTPRLTTYGGLSAQSFSVEFDSGPVTHPQHIRREGDDALQFAILVDASESDNRDLAKSLIAALRGPAPPLFNAQDRISVYASDCAIVRSLEDIPASSPALRAGLLEALASPLLQTRGPNGVCTQRHHLWDTLQTISLHMGKLPGRRVLLVLTSGQDLGSRLSWPTVERFAAVGEVTVFGVRSVPLISSFYSFGPEERQRAAHTPEDIFAAFCGGTGGYTFTENVNTAALILPRLLALIRDRYILDFQRPQNGAAGEHTIDVTVPDSSAIVRTSGVNFTAKRQTHLDDPSIVPSDLSNAPRFGDRKVMTPPN